MSVIVIIIISVIGGIFFIVGIYACIIGHRAKKSMQINSDESGQILSPDSQGNSSELKTVY